MVHVEITPSESPQGSSFRVVARKPRDDYRFGIIMTSTKEGTVTVRGVAKDSVLAIEGLQTGDVLLEIGNQKIDSAKAVSWSLSQAKANDTIELFVFRPPLSERLGPAAEVSLPKATMESPFPVTLEATDSNQLCVVGVSDELLSSSSICVGDMVLLVNGMDMLSPEDAWRAWMDADQGTDFKLMVARPPYIAPPSTADAGRQI